MQVALGAGVGVASGRAVLYYESPQGAQGRDLLNLGGAKS